MIIQDMKQRSVCMQSVSFKMKRQKKPKKTTNLSVWVTSVHLHLNWQPQRVRLERMNLRNCRKSRKPHKISNWKDRRKRAKKRRELSSCLSGECQLVRMSRHQPEPKQKSKLLNNNLLSINIWNQTSVKGQQICKTGQVFHSLKKLCSSNGSDWHKLERNPYHVL